MASNSRGNSPASRFAAYSTRATSGHSTQAVNVRLPEDLIEKLTEIGNRDGLSMSDTIRMVLWRGIRTTQDPTELAATVSSLQGIVTDLQNTVSNFTSQEDS